MATGGEEQVSYSLVNDRTVTLEDPDESLNPNEIPRYDSIVISEETLIVVDTSDGQKGKVKSYGLHNGNFLNTLDSVSRPRAICLKDNTTICVLHDDGLIQMVSIENVPPVFTEMKKFRLHRVHDDDNPVFDEYHSIVIVNESIVVVGVKQNTTHWCIASLDTGCVEQIYRICTQSKRSSVTTKNNIIYISCEAEDSNDTGVYAFDTLKPSQRIYQYKKLLRDPTEEKLRSPRSIVINENGNIFVGDLHSIIHQLTYSCQRFAIFNQGIPEKLQAMFWYNGLLYVTCWGSRDITVFRYECQERKQPIIVETFKGQGNVDKCQSSEEMETHPSIQIPMDYKDGKQDNLTEDRIWHLLSNESDLKAYISDDPPEACIKTLLSHASKLSSKESMKIILHFIVQQFAERFSVKPIRVWAGEEVIGPENVQKVLVCFYSGLFDRSMKSVYGLKVFYRDYNATDKESALARAHERNKKSYLTPKHCDLINEAITIHGNGLFAKHSNLEAISSSEILSSKSRGLVEETCVILYCRVKGIIPFGEMPFPKRLNVNEKGSIAVDVREGYFSSHADSRNIDQEKKFQNDEDSLRMGSSVGRAGICKGGTIGPFVKISSNKTGFLTCAHVVFSEDELKTFASTPQTDPILKKIVQPSDMDSDLSLYQQNRVCGNLFSAVFRGNWSTPSSTEAFGIDAALIEITSRFPDAGAFVPIAESQLVDAGFSQEQPPKFDSGEMLSYPIIETNQKSVIKIGKSSGLTRGHLRLTQGIVKYSSISMPHMIMQKLMEISPVGLNNEFSKDGDSGAGVFLVDNDHKLTCVGLLVGRMEDGASLAMPIDKILTALHRGDDMQITLKDFENEALV